MAKRRFSRATASRSTSHAGLSALVATRIHPDYFPEDEELPAIAYALEDERSMHTQQWPSALREAVYRFEAWLETVGVVRQLRAALDGYRGGFKDIHVAGAFFDGAGRSRDPDTESFCVSTRFTIHYREV